MPCKDFAGRLWQGDVTLAGCQHACLIRNQREDSPLNDLVIQSGISTGATLSCRMNWRHLPKRLLPQKQLPVVPSDDRRVLRLHMHHVGGRDGNFPFVLPQMFHPEVESYIYDADPDCLEYMKTPGTSFSGRCNDAPYMRNHWQRSDANVAT